MTNKGYSHLMKEAGEYLRLEIDLTEPIELLDLSAMLASMGEQYDAYAVKHHNAGRGVAKFYVKEISQGSIIIDILSDPIDLMDKALIVGGFAALFSERVRGFIQGNLGNVLREDKKAGKWVASIVRAVAKDPDGRLALKKISIDEGPDSAEVIVEFHTPDAQLALQHSTSSHLLIEKEQEEAPLQSRLHKRVLMRYTRPDIFDADINKSTGERVIINEIDNRPRPLMYGSEIAEDAIKNVIRERRIFKLGFNVDVMTQVQDGKLKAYKLVNLHQVIEIDDENDTPPLLQG